ncbi:MAG: hypothetical protein OCC46_14435 [Pseudodesulfovibrio sp.]
MKYFKKNIGLSEGVLNGLKPQAASFSGEFDKSSITMLLNVRGNHG